MLCPDSRRAVDFGFSAPPSLPLPKIHPQRVPPSPATQSTDQEGITIFMLSVTGIRGLQRKQFGCFNSSAQVENPSQGERGDRPS